MMPWSKAKPYPYWLRIEREGATPVGVMLRLREDGQMVGRTVRKVDAVSPNTYEYGNLDPYKERPYVFGPLTGGVGESVQVGHTPRRYKYAKRQDISIGGQRRLGPYFRAEQLAPAGSAQFVNQMAVGRHAGADTLFALVGKYVYRNTAGAWVLSRVDAGGYQHLQAVQYKGTAGSDRFWATNDNGQLWGYDGAAWAMAALPAGFRAYHIEKVGTELWVFGGNANGNNVLRVVTAGDPMLAASYGGEILVGSPSKSATWLRAVGGSAYLFKEDGIFSVTNDGGTVTVNDLFPELRDVTSAQYGRNAAPWRGYLWFQFGAGFWRLDEDGTLDPVGPERIHGLDSRLRRPGVAFAGHGDWFGYLVTEATDLLKFGEWVNTDDLSAPEFADVWNGSLADWNAKTATSVFVTTAVGGVPRLYVGFNDGSVEYTRLPQYSPDPADDAACEFVTGGSGEESYLEWPDHHAMAQADQKHWRAFAATGPRIDADHYVDVEYRTDPDAAWTPLGTSLTEPAERVTTPSSVTGQIVQVRESLHGTRTSTPKVEAVVLHEQVRPDLQIEWQATAVAGNRTPRRDGVVDRRSAQQIRLALMATAGPGPTTVVMPDETTQQVDFVDYGEALRNEGQRWGLEWDIPITMVQFEALTVYGTWGRVGVLTWGDVAAYQWGQLPRL